MTSPTSAPLPRPLAHARVAGRVHHAVADDARSSAASTRSPTRRPTPPPPTTRCTGGRATDGQRHDLAGASRWCAATWCSDGGHLAGRSVVVTGAGGGDRPRGRWLFARGRAPGAQRSQVRPRGRRRSRPRPPTRPWPRPARRRGGGDRYDSVATPEGRAAVVEAAVGAFGGRRGGVPRRRRARADFLKPTTAPSTRSSTPSPRRVERRARRRPAHGRPAPRRAHRADHGRARDARRGGPGGVGGGQRGGVRADAGAGRRLKKHHVPGERALPAREDAAHRRPPDVPALGEDKLRPAFVAPAVLFLASGAVG